jgi:hypothetical protein
MKLIKSAFSVAVLASVLIAFTLSFSAYGDDSDKQAERLKTVFTNMLENYARESNTAETHLVMEGSVMVENAGSYYAVTLPHLSFAHPTGEKFEIGIIAINAVPAENKTIKMTVALPTPMTFYDANGTAKLKTTIGAQTLSGLWHEDMKSFTKLKAQYKDILVQSAIEDTMFRISEAKILANLEQNANGNWSGPFNIDIYNAETQGKNKADYGKFGHIGIHTTVEDYSLDTVKKYESSLEALSESYEAGDSPSISSAHLTALYSLITEVMMNAWDGFTTEFTMSDVEIKMPPKTGRDAELVQLKNASYSFDMGGFRKNSVFMRTALSFDGLNVEPRPSDFNYTAPTSVNFDIKINNIPFREIVNLGKTSVEAGTANPQMAQMVALQAMMSIPQLITQAGTEIIIKDNAVSNNTYDVLVNGKLTANLKAAFGATGESTIEVHGMDKLISASKALLDDPELTEEEKQDIQKNIKSLTVLEIAGQQATNDKGQPVRTYKFTLDEQGQTLMNGSDIKALIDQVK